VEVTFDIDANGILSVTAKDKATGKEQKVTITASTNLNKSEIDRMVNEATQHRSEDDQRKQLIEARNQGDSLVYQAEKTLRDLGEKVPGDKRSDVEARVKTLREAIQGNDLNAIQSASQALQNDLQAVGQAAYQQSSPGDQQGPSTPPPSSNDGEDVIDGEYKET
jgi:molecular chaperone DnaK